MKIPYFCSYIPAALLEALGHELQDISLFTEETCGLEYSCALHDNLCSYAKYLYRKILAEEKGFELAVVPNSCDAMKKLHTALARTGRMPAFLLDIPRRSGEEAAAYLAAQYASLLAAIAPDIAPGELLRRLRDRGSARISPPAETRGDDAAPPLRIGIAGSSYAPAFFRTALARYSAGAVFLRHCGYGRVPAPPAEAVAASLAEQLFRMAESTLQHTLCPRSDRGGLTDYLLAETRAQRLVGLVFTSLKFCDFYAFEFERIRRRLPDDFPLLYLENDLSVGNDEQNRTRIEAFLEKIRSGGTAEMPRPPAAAPPQPGMALGLDIGSAATKGVLLKDGGQILAAVILPTSLDMRDGAEAAIAALLREGGMIRREGVRICLTGYGRTAFADREQVTEITCHALGVHFLRPAGATVIDVGGQDSKAIRIDAAGRVLRFAMNDKCAAGTGRFLESMVKRMNIGFADFSALSLAAAEATPISSMCSVFAESEVVSLMARGVPAASIARGLNAAVAARIRGLVGKIQGGPPFVLTGGMAQNPGFIRELETALASPVTVFAQSQLAGAIGAALTAASGVRPSTGGDSRRTKG